MIYLFINYTICLGLEIHLLLILLNDFSAKSITFRKSIHSLEYTKDENEDERGSRLVILKNLG